MSIYFLKWSVLLSTEQESCPAPPPLSSLHPPKSIRFSLRRKYYRKIFNLSVGGTCEPPNMGVGFCVLSLTAFLWRKFLKRHVSDKSNLKSEIILQKHCVGIIESERRAFLKASIQKRLWHLIRHFFVRVCLNFFTFIFTLWMQESLQSRSWFCVQDYMNSALMLRRHKSTGKLPTITFHRFK